MLRPLVFRSLAIFKLTFVHTLVHVHTINVNSNVNTIVDIIDLIHENTFDFASGYTYVILVFSEARSKPQRVMFSVQSERVLSFVTFCRSGTFHLSICLSDRYWFIYSRLQIGKTKLRPSALVSVDAFTGFSSNSTLSLDISRLFSFQGIHVKAL